MYLFSEVPDSRELSDKTAYGTAAVLKTADHLQSLIDSYKPIDIRYSRGIMEHKFFMAKRIKYLNRIGVFNDVSLVQKADNIYEQSQRIHLLGIKYNMTGKSNFGIKALIEKMTMEEKEYLPVVLSNLER